MNIQRPNDPNNLTPLEKTHWPKINPINPKVARKFIVQISVPGHPMDAEHLIIYIEAFYGSKPIGKKFLKPGDEPLAEFWVAAVKKEKIKAIIFCNLHGLWQNEAELELD